MQILTRRSELNKNCLTNALAAAFIAVGFSLSAIEPLPSYEVKIQVDCATP